jgi:hypothetical protein
MLWVAAFAMNPLWPQVPRLCKRYWHGGRNYVVATIIAGVGGFTAVGPHPSPLTPVQPHRPPVGLPLPTPYTRSSLPLGQPLVRPWLAGVAQGMGPPPWLRRAARGQHWAGSLVATSGKG